MCATHLELDVLFAEVKCKARIHDLASYLATDSLRRQANTVVRPTAVTIVGLIGTITTGWLGMDLLAEAEAEVPMARRPLTEYTMANSERLSDFLDALSDERFSG